MPVSFLIIAVYHQSFVSMYIIVCVCVSVKQATNVYIY